MFIGFMTAVGGIFGRFVVGQGFGKILAAIEDFMAMTATHQPSGNSQLLISDAEAGLTFGTAGKHGQF